MTDVSIVVPAYIKKGTPLLGLTVRVLDKLLNFTKGMENNEVILVDDGCDKKCIEVIGRRFPDVKIVGHEVNMGFAKAVNTGIRASKGKKILLLNNDVDITGRGWLNNLLAGMEQSGADIVAPKQSILDDSFQYIPDAQRHKYREDKCFSYPVGWCLMVNRKVFEKAGLLPVNFGQGFWEDTAWFFNIKNNYPEFKSFIVDGVDKVDISHMEHQTFRSLGFNISNQYRVNRDLFMRAVRNEVRLDFPKL